MELRQLEHEVDIPLEDAPETGSAAAERRPRTRGGKWRLLILLPVFLVAAGLLLLWHNRVGLLVRLDPLRALERGVERVKPLPEPLSLGFLGEVVLGEETVQCSGVLDLAAKEEGLTLYLKDCTLGNGEGSAAWSAYLSPDLAAVSAPQLTGTELWYGVDLNTPLEEQAAGTGGDPAWGWYFDPGRIALAQQAADLARQGLSQVQTLGLGQGERQALEQFLEGSLQGAEAIDGGYALSFSQLDQETVERLADGLGAPQGALVGPLTADVSLNEAGTLRCVSAASGNLDFTLELGEDPATEPTPRLEANWTDAGGRECSLTLAFTLDQAGAMRPPTYRNAFSLLPKE